MPARERSAHLAHDAALRRFAIGTLIKNTHDGQVIEGQVCDYSGGYRELDSLIAIGMKLLGGKWNAT